MDDDALLQGLAPIAEALGFSPERVLADLRTQAEVARRLSMRREQLRDLPRLVGPTTVAKWCGVGKSAISNWLRRYEDWPDPVGIFGSPGRESYLWREDQEQEWLSWVQGLEVQDLEEFPGHRLSYAIRATR